MSSPEATTSKSPNPLIYEVECNDTFDSEVSFVLNN